MRDRLSRRSFIATGVTGSVLTAGCVGGNSSGNGNGGTTSSNGDSSTSDSGTSTISITSFPVNVDGLTNTYIDNSGILGEELDEVGYDYEMQFTFEGPPQFVAGNTEVAHDISALEAARLTQEQDMDLAVIARIQTAFMGMHVVPGGPYDPEETGSIQATLDKAAEENASVGILGWGVGDVPPTQLVMQRLYDKAFFQDNSDFEVATSSPSAMPKLVVDGELAMGSFSATHGAASQLLNDELKPLYFGVDLLQENGWGTPPLSDVVTTQEFLENNREACAAIARALNRGTDWVYNDAIDEAPEDPELRDILIAEEPEAAEYALEYHIEDGTKYSPESTTLWEDNGVTDEWVENTKTALRNAEEVDQLESGWEDRLEFVQF
jgi:ABC-type nitrate/sulfonate/bicarbonate transport system substrate-binding protein